MTPLVVVVGPTASGKSAVAHRLAMRLGAEIVTGDSMQVYRGMDIGTATPTADERAEVRHHLLDVVDPWERFDVATYQRLARAAIADIDRRGSRALLVGGTGLYVQSIVDDLELPGRFPEVRAQLAAEADTGALHDRLTGLDPVAAARMEPTNRRRVLRALEVTIGAGRPFSSFGPGMGAFPPVQHRVFGLDRSLDDLDARIAGRYDRQLADGFLDEVAALRAGPPPSRTAAQALGYRELLAHLEGTCTLDEALDQAVGRTRRFARRQRRWFRRDPRIEWLSMTPSDDPGRVAERISRRLAAGPPVAGLRAAD